MAERSEYDESLQSLLEDPDGYIARGEMLKSADSTTVALIKLPGRALVVKRYNIKNSWHRFKRAFTKDLDGFMKNREAHPELTRQFQGLLARLYP